MDNSTMNAFDKYITTPLFALYNITCKISYAFAESEFAQKMGLSLLWMYSSLCVKMDQLGIYLYNNVGFVHIMVDEVEWLNEQIAILRFKGKREPTSENWISICVTNIVSDDKFMIGKYTDTNNKNTRYFETYQILNNLSISELQQSFTNTFVEPSSILDPNIDNTSNVIIIMKMNDRYRISICNPRFSENPIDQQPYDLSNYGLLSATYSHPKMTEPIVLQIPREMFVVGNHLFSSTFVYRQLTYQGAEFIFDVDYTINLIDNNVNQLALTSNQYLLIGLDIGTVEHENNVNSEPENLISEPAEIEPADNE